MEQQFNNDQNEFLRALLANPEGNGHLHGQDLERLVNQHPHSGILQALLAYINEEKNLKRASVYFAPPALYKLINTPSALTEVPADRIIRQNGTDNGYQEITSQPEIPANDEEVRVAHDIDDETYEEIVGIEDIDTKTESFRVPLSEQDKTLTESDIETNFFKLDEPFGQTEEEGSELLVEEPTPTPTPQEISRYNDDKMPYTFMWWLDKTRREHAGTHQPYLKPEEPAAGHFPAKTDELQQQYYENIFHINSLDELEKKAAPQSSAIEGKCKEDIIIERFIQEEPQIKPQSSDKIDTENKAKKSAEDHDELVTETLAAIYTDQMLYNKAIASYKKLMLKFPEKSRYFAAKIEQLEKRTN